MESGVAKEIRDRIWSAADYLYEEAGRGDVMPTVDAVRRHARANMNDVSLVMKEWRGAQKATVKSVSVQVPEALASLSVQSLGAMWQQAQDHANESLRAAQASWDAERIENEALTAQISQAFDEQAGILATTQAESRRLSALSDDQARLIEDLNRQVLELKSMLSAAKSEAGQANVRAAEIDNKAHELRKELDHAHDLAQRAAAQAERDRADGQKRMDDLKRETDEARQAHATEIGKLQSRIDSLNQDCAEARVERDHARQEHQAERENRTGEAAKMQEKLASLTTERDEARAERKEARSESREAREVAAKQSGELEALKAQIASMGKTRKP